MNAGHIEQIGMPEAVYARPTTTFVACFIGWPPMNLLAGRADGLRFAGDGDGDGRDANAGEPLMLPAEAPRAAALILGLRPEHAAVTTSGTAGWPFNVELVEMLGAGRLHRFDPATGIRVHIAPS